MIAPFWTGLDFITGKSEIDTHLVRGLNWGYYFIIEWVNMHERGTANSYCTFDVALRIYDKNFQDKCENDAYDDLGGIHIASSYIWFAYFSLPTPASSFVWGIEIRLTCNTLAVMNQTRMRQP